MELGLLERSVFRDKTGRLIGMCRELYDHRDWLRTFLKFESVESTNNAAERSLHHAGIWRRLLIAT